MIPDFAGDVVIAVRHEYAVEIWTERSWEFRLAGHTLLDLDGLGPRLIDNDSPPDPSDTQLSSVVVLPNGRLEIALGAGRISVDPEDHWEAWELSGGHGAKVVCTPGGELVTWPRRGKEET